MRQSGGRGTAGAALVVALGLVFATFATVPVGAQTAPNPPPTAESKLTPVLAELAQPSVQALSPSEQAEALNLPASGAGSLLERNGRVLVYVRVTSADPATVDAIAGVGAQIVDTSERYAVVTVEIAPTDLNALAALASVLSVQEVLEPSVGGAPAAVPGQVQVQATCPTGANVSEADTQLRAALARTAFGVDGTGIKIGVLSDSYDTSASAVTHAATDVASGDLPGTANPCGHTTPVTVLSQTAGGSDEGRAMLQAIHDLAPGAQLAFATAFNGETAMATEIHALQAWGADIIVDDVSYFAEPFFQDGPITVAIDEVTAMGVSYFSSAGNNNLIVGGQSVGSYAAPAFRPTACPATVAPFADSCHDFAPLAGVDTGWDFTIANGGRLRVDFQYAEPRDGVTHNFDLYLLNAATDAVIGFSKMNNLGNQVPFEYIQQVPWSGPSTNVKVVIARVDASGTPPVKFVLLSSGGISNVEYNASSNGDVVGPTLYGHNAATNAGSTAAVPFDDSTRAESFTSRGPTTLYFGPVNGTTPAAPLGAPQFVAKPDFAATDGGRNSFFGNNFGGVQRFYGTSQSAPHAAAVAALLLQYQPALTPGKVRDLLAGYADSVPTATQDTVGAGLVDALESIQRSGPKIKRFSPAAGPAGTDVVIDGGNFVNVTAVAFNGTPGTNVQIQSATQLTVTVPAGATTGKITVSNPDATATSAPDFSAGVAIGGRFTGMTPVRALDTRNTGPCVSSSPRNLTVGGQLSVPVSATAVALNVTAVAPSGDGFLTVWPAGQARPLASNLNFVGGQITPNMVTVKLGAGGAISIYANNGCPDVVVDVAGYFTGPGAAGPGGFTGITPLRALDTRNTGPCVGTSPRTLTLASQSGPVPINATAVALNVTVVTPSLPGFLTVWPNGLSRPLASNLNFVPGQIVPNMVTVKLNNGGISLFADKGCPDLVVDVAGYYEGGGPAGPGGFTGITPVRALDTRNTGPCVSTTPRNLTLRPTFVPSGADAVALNVTVVAPSGEGFLTVWPAGQATPLASNLNFVAGQIVPNMVTVKLGAGGAISIYANNGCPDVVVDVAGYYTSP